MFMQTRQSNNVIGQIDVVMYNKRYVDVSAALIDIIATIFFCKFAT